MYAWFLFSHLFKLIKKPLCTKTKGWQSCSHISAPISRLQKSYFVRKLIIENYCVSKYLRGYGILPHQVQSHTTQFLKTAIGDVSRICFAFFRLAKHKWCDLMLTFQVQLQYNVVWQQTKIWRPKIIIIRFCCLLLSVRINTQGFLSTFTFRIAVWKS